ncbi:MAG: hypothetical protein IJY23_02335 [Clostridia bacterium]|nr:hypothetical protein [Clostridia bacterium]
MKITFLIGNGFDVGVGMNSRFKDFFPIYEAKSRTKENRIKMLSEEINGDYDTWADFEFALGKYTVKFTKETKQDFLDQLKDFEGEFIEYLKLQESMLSFDEEKTISEHMINALRGYYDGGKLAPESRTTISNIYSNHASEDYIYNFVNFNYTTVLEECLKTISQGVVGKRKHSGERVDKIGKIVHVHGKSDLHPIIGVNDVSQIENKELAGDSRFIRYIVKPQLNQYLRYGNDSATTDVINSSTIICVYGMSLGATDKKWWQNILSWLNNNGERQLVIFDYDNTYTQSNQFSWLEKEDGLIDKLTKFSTGADVEKLRSRIHIAVHKNIFEMDLSKQKREAYGEALQKVLARV